MGMDPMSEARAAEALTMSGRPRYSTRQNTVMHRIAVFLASFALVVMNFGIIESLTGSTAYAVNFSGAELDQCYNGAVGPPLVRAPCQGSNLTSVSVAIPGINGGASTAYKDWQNGDANGQKSHWRENDFISYRALVGGITAGVHTLDITYSPERSGLHAIDYLGSYDATEGSSTTPST